LSFSQECFVCSWFELSLAPFAKLGNAPIVFSEEVVVKNIKRLLLVAAAAMVAAIFGAVAGPGRAEAQAPRPPTPVEIIAPVPVPVSGSLGISGTANVNVSNTAASPALTRDVDNPARAPFQAVLCSRAAFSGGTLPTCVSPASSLTVVAGRTLVIEYVGADCAQTGLNFLELQVSTTVGGVASSYDVHLAFNVFDQRFLDGAQSTRIYADGGSVVGIGMSAGSSGGTPGSVSCNLRLSGYSIAS
jgi:hypothetical protein